MKPFLSVEVSRAILNFMKIVFAGTPDEACMILGALVPQSTITHVISQPDRPSGRGGRLTSPPVGFFASLYKIPLLQPARIREASQEIAASHPDFLVVVAYGQKIPQAILSLPKYGCINVHFSLLPKYRGASPVQEALLHGDSETGYSIMLMTEGIDEGPILAQKKIAIAATDTCATLKQKIARTAADDLFGILSDFMNKKIQPREQAGNASHCRKIEKSDGELHPMQEGSVEILQKIRAYDPWPGTYIIFKGKRLKILSASDYSEQKNYSQIDPGVLHVFDTSVLAIGTKDGNIYPTLVQLEGKSAMSVADFLKGNPV